MGKNHTMPMQATQYSTAVHSLKCEAFVNDSKRQGAQREQFSATGSTSETTRKWKQDSTRRISGVRWQAASEPKWSRGAAEPQSRRARARWGPGITAVRASPGPDWFRCRCLTPGITAQPSRIEAQRCTDTWQSCKEETQTPAPAQKRQEGKRVGNELRLLSGCVSKEVCGIAAARERTSRGQEARGEAKQAARY
ncbi:hypothetical protein NDU88_005180 [Pleurodeles waltl]|uniref:Uncharacterized protein n=1 Tax=Pleurodeles waltl TaxID=8319 RepID=A0AAV7VM06_PLEWA|nr:hypothetical protein NDU88_005180 [Pleurodeles waltl]